VRGGSSDGSGLLLAGLDVTLEDEYKSLAEAITGQPDGWALSNIPFLAARGQVGHMVMDTGAAVTCISSNFLERAGLLSSVRPHSEPRRLRVANGAPIESLGLVDVDITIQVMLDVSETDEPVFVHWDRRVCLKNVWAMPFPEAAPRDLYVSYRDWNFSRPRDTGPLGTLAQMVLKGAKVYASPRAPAEGAVDIERYVVMETATHHVDESATLAGILEGIPKEKLVQDYNEEELREAIFSRIPPDKRGLPIALRLVDELVRRRKIFNAVDPAECTVQIEMTMIGTPKPVSFRVPIRRGDQSEAAKAGIMKWMESGVSEWVPWDTPAYGFVIIVPKAGGKWRVTINPTELNRITEKFDPEGGYMPDSMIREAMKAGYGCRHAANLDFTEAFTTLRLGPRAQELSTFTTPYGKIRFKNGFYGWHSFPAHFQTMMMEKIVLPTMDEVPLATILDWIDDMIVGAEGELDFLTALLMVVDRALALGLRLNLFKCNFLADRFDWCGVEIDVLANEWRLAPTRVSSLLDTPVPTDRAGLEHVMGILRYYYFGVTDQNAQRGRLALLQELNVPGIVLAEKWTDAHTTAMRDAFKAIAAGDWILCYNPKRRVYVSCDASGNHGWCVTAWQEEEGSGRFRPVAFVSHGWEGPQIK